MHNLLSRLEWRNTIYSRPPKFQRRSLFAYLLIVQDEIKGCSKVRGGMKRHHTVRASRSNDRCRHTHIKTPDTEGSVHFSICHAL